MKFYSHPDKLLITHLKEVNELAKNYCKEEYREVEEIISLCHDFGKYTTFFQDYLLGKEKIKTEKNSHSFVSAIFGAYIAIDKYGEGSMYPLIVYNCILYHHGSVKNLDWNLPASFKEIIKSEFKHKLEIAEEQIINIKGNRNIIAEDYNKVAYAEYFNKFLDGEFIEETVKRLKKQAIKFQHGVKSEEVYFVFQLLYSSLIASDKISASGIILPQIKFAASQKLLEEKCKKFKNIGESHINNIRNEIFFKVQEEIEKKASESNIFSITSPTGTGKTYCGFFAALKLKELLKDNRKIIYALPYTSIINQNYSSIYELYKSIEDFEKESSEYIIKHHSLADVEYSSEYENYSKIKAEMLIENWNSGIVITTFVQLLETLISSKNRMLKKFSALNKAIILLDEVQAIDLELLKLVEFILKAAAKYLDCKVIMMTATKPIIFPKATELLVENKKYFAMFNRTKLIPEIKSIAIDQFIEEFYEKLEEKSYLIICNTIAQSLKIYNELKNSGRDVLYLSTNLLPIHRRQRIEEVTDLLKKGEKIILVSTQVVEAGVDFDFDVVIRDLAPIDSIIQAAGRCNRNGRKKEGKVYIYSMVNENGNYYGRSVYGTSSINIAKELLENCKEIQEEQYLKLIQVYFEKVYAVKNKDCSVEFINAIKNMYFNLDKENDRSINKFSLIKDNENYIDVFFRINEAAEKVFNEFLKARATKDLDLKNERMLEIKNKLREYIISIPLKHINRLNNKDDLMLNLPESACEIYYDNMTGYKREEEEDFFVM